MRACGCVLILAGLAFGVWAVVPGGPYARDNRTGIGVVASGIGGLVAGWGMVRRKRAPSPAPAPATPRTGSCPGCGQPAQGRFCASCGKPLG